MVYNPSLKKDNTPRTSPEAPFTTFIELDGSPPSRRGFVFRGLSQLLGSSRRWSPLFMDCHEGEAAF
jgi:hypothetical protein